MNCKKVLACVFLVLLLAACSGEKKSEIPQTEPTSSKPAATSTQSPAADRAQESASTTTDGSCRSIMEAACLSCHSESRICQKLGKKSKKRWKRTIARMVKRGSKINSADQNILIDCLVDESADIVQMCK